MLLINIQTLLKNKSMPNREIPIKSRKQIADEYSTETEKVTVKLLNEHIEKYELPIKPYSTFFPKQQKDIYETFGYPLSVDRELYKNV